MNVIINGKTETLTEGLSLGELLVERGLVPTAVVVEHNNNIVARGAFEETRLGEGDQLEILSFVGGG